MNTAVTLLLSVLVSSAAVAFHRQTEERNPFRDLPIRASSLSESWVISGPYWRRNMWRTYDYSSIQAATSEEFKPQHSDKISFSTCQEMAPNETSPRQSFLKSPIFRNDHLPRHRLPAVVQVEFFIYVSETCVEARRESCFRGIDIWLSESKQELTSNSQLIFTGDTEAWRLVPFVKQLKNGINILSLPFRVNRTPFYLIVQDARGACLEIKSAKMEAVSCGIARAITGKDIRKTTTTTSKPGADFNYDDNEITLDAGSRPLFVQKPKLQLLDELDCFCSAGFHMQQDGIKCVSCPPHTYSPTPHGLKNCLPCPELSTASDWQNNLCKCLPNTWRVAGEGINTPCGRPPSPPIDHGVYYMDTHKALVNWSAPLDFGNRTDVTYQVECIESCRGISLTRDWAAAGADQSVIVSLDDPRVNSRRTVKIRIYSLNGVSAAAGPKFARFIEPMINLPKYLNESENQDSHWIHAATSVIGPLGLVAVLAGAIVAGCVIFCVVRMIQEPELWRRKKPRVKILGEHNNRRTSVMEDDSHSSTRKHPVAVMAQGRIASEGVISASFDYQPPQPPLLRSVLLRNEKPHHLFQGSPVPIGSIHSQPLLDNPESEDYKSFIDTDGYPAGYHSLNRMSYPFAAPRPMASDFHRYQELAARQNLLESQAARTYMSPSMWPYYEKPHFTLPSRIHRK